MAVVSEFKALYFEILYIQSKIALEECCRDIGSVQLGFMSLEECLDKYLEKARLSEEFQKATRSLSETVNLPQSDPKASL